MNAGGADDTRIYSLPAAWSYGFYFVGSLLLAFLSLFVYLFFFESPEYTYSIGLLVFFAFAALLGLYVISIGLKRRTHSIETGKDGIRYPYSRKSSWVPWSDIAHVSMNDFRQRIEMKNARGRTLLKIRYDLVGFNDLQYEITLYLGRDSASLQEALERGKTMPSRELRFPRTFQKRWSKHKAVAAFLLFGLFAGLVICCQLESDLVLGLWLLFFTIIAGVKFINITLSVAVTNSYVEVIKILGRTRIHYQDITRLEYGPDLVSGRRIPWEIRITCSNGMLYIINIGKDSLELYQAVKYGRERSSEILGDRSGNMQ